MRTGISAEIELTVEFYDVDSMRIVWHGNYIKYFEKARCALLGKIGYGYREMEESGWAFPITAVSVKYVNSLAFQDRVRARAALTEYKTASRYNTSSTTPPPGGSAPKGKAPRWR